MLRSQMSKLRKENRELKIENEKTSTALQSTVVDLQRQMSEAIGIALQKNAALTQQLAEAQERILQLEGNEQGIEEDEGVFFL